MKDNVPKLLNDKGVTAIIVALLMTVFLGIAALAVDIGYNVMAKNQLQNAADAAALAGARQLGKIYKDMSITDINNQHTNYLSADNQTLVRNAALSAASANKAAGVSITLNDADITIGNWNAITKKIVSPDVFPLAVQVIARNNNISTFFAKIFGKQTMALQVVATAALSAQCTGEKSPFTISKSWFYPNNCPSNYLTWDGNDGNGTDSGITNCVAWRGNKKSVLPVMNCINGTNTDCPDSQVNAEVPYSNGTQDNLFDKSDPNLLDLFDYMKSRDNDGSNATWTTEVEITDFICGQGSGNSSNVWGYATIVISDVLIPDPKHPTKTMRAIKFTSDCKIVQDGRGGGCNGPNIGDIPSLVQ